MHATAVHKKAQLEYDSCDEPYLDKNKEKKKREAWLAILNNSETYKCLKKKLSKKRVVWWFFSSFCLVLGLVLIPIGATHNSTCWVMIPLGITLVFVWLLLLLPAALVLTNRMYYKLNKKKLCLVYVTCFKKCIYYDEQLVYTGKAESKPVVVTLKDVTIHDYCSEFTYWIYFNKEAKVRKRFGQYYNV